PEPVPIEIYALSLHDALPISAGSTNDFTLDANAMLAQHFPGINLSTVTMVGVGLESTGGVAQFSNLCLTSAPSPCSTGQDTTPRSEEHTSELQSRFDLVCRLL